MEPILAAFPVPYFGGIVRIQSYALAHLLALLVLLVVTLRTYARDVGEPAPALDVLVAAVAAGLVGAVLVGAATSGTVPELHVRTLWSGYRSAYGGLLFGTLAGWEASRLRGLPALRLLDSAAPGLAWGAFLCRLGCFLGGCCWGAATRSAFGVRFPFDHPAMLRLPAGEGWALHPTQLYLAGSALVIAIVLSVMRARGLGRSGERFVVGAVLYAVSTFAVESLRADPGRWFALGFSHSQWISVLILAAIFLHRTGRSMVRWRAP